MANPEGAKVLGELFKVAMAHSQMAKKDDNGEMSLSPAMMKMMGSFTCIRLVGMMGVMGGNADKEGLLAVNAQLNKIKK